MTEECSDARHAGLVTVSGITGAILALCARRLAGCFKHSWVAFRWSKSTAEGGMFSVVASIGEPNAEAIDSIVQAPTVSSSVVASESNPQFDIENQRIGAEVQSEPVPLVITVQSQGLDSTSSEEGL